MERTMFVLFEEFERNETLDLSCLSDVYIISGKDGVYEEIQNIEEEVEKLEFDCNKIIFLRDRLDVEVYDFDQLDYILEGKSPKEIVEMMEGSDFNSGFYYGYFGINEIWNNLEFYSDIYAISSDFDVLDDFLYKIKEELDKQKELYFDEELEQEWNYQKIKEDEIGCIYLY